MRGDLCTFVENVKEVVEIFDGTRKYFYVSRVQCVKMIERLKLPTYACQSRGDDFKDLHFK